MLTLRPIPPPELPPEMEPHWSLGAFEDEALAGTIYVSTALGNLWVHDLAYWGQDKTGVLRLSRALHAEFKGQQLHMSTTQFDIAKTAARFGWEPVSITCRIQL